MNPPRLSKGHILSVCAFFLLVFCLSTRADYVTSWPPGSCSTVASVPIGAVVSASTPSIKLIFPRPGAYQIFRKGPYDTSWGTALTTLSGSSTSWTDTNVSVGQFYEYKAVMTDGPKGLYIPNVHTYASGSGAPIGYVLSGINVDETMPRGRIIVVVSSDVPTNLTTEYAQYISDLQADGWFVHVIQTARAAAAYDVTGSNALASVTVTAGGTGYTTGTVGLATTVSGTPRAIASLTLSSGTITAVNILSGGAGGSFNVGDPLYLIKYVTGSAITGAGASLSVGSVTSGSSNPIPIRNQIMAIYNQYPGEVKNVVMLGRVPTCRTGSGEVWDPDGHGVNLAGYGADGYYANMTGTWTDTGSDFQDWVWGYGGYSLSTGILNFPGDNKFDQYYMADTGGQADMGFGRIDTSNGIYAEFEGLRAYLNKLHRYKIASADFQPGRKIALRNGAFPNVDETCWTCAIGISGTLANVDVVKTLPSNINGLDTDAEYSAQNGPYLFYFKGSGGPGVGTGGKAVFWTGMQSHWGWWYGTGITSNENCMPLRLGEDDYLLSITWDIFGTRYYYHRMGMGLDAGDMMRVSINNADSATGIYAFVTDPGGTYAPCISTCTGGLFMNHFGDPAIRLFMFAPPSNLQVVAQGGQPILTWTSSTDASVTGYHVYRTPLVSGTVAGPATRITSNPVSGTTYTDTDPAAGPGTGQWSYMVRAVRLETTGCGTFYNASLGVSQSIDMTNPPAALQITTPAVLPDVYWNTAYLTTLSAQGGTPLYNWSVVSGTLPPGLSLAPLGMFLGTTINSGTYSFTAQATDSLGQTAQRAFTITAQSNNTITLFPEASSYEMLSSTTRVQGSTESIQVQSSAFYSFLRFNMTGITSNNYFASARLRIYVDPGTATTCGAILGAALVSDSPGATWDVGTIDYANMPADNASVTPTLATVYPVSSGYVDIDVTPQLAAYFANYTSGKISFRLFTKANQLVNLGSAYSYDGARPQLIIQTTNAPNIVISSPTVNPAFIYQNSGLRITASATTIPATAANLTTKWSQVSGPGTATFSTTTQPSTTVTFSAPGDYVLQLAANDGVLQSYKTVTVRVLSLPSNATVLTTGPVDHLAMRLPLDESSGTIAHDVSGVTPANSGTLITGSSASLPVWSSSGGKIGGALSFSGSGQQVVVPDSSTNLLDGTPQITVSFWCYPTAISATSAWYDSMVSKGASYGFSIRGGSTTNGSLYFSLAGKSLGYGAAAQKLYTGNWYNIALVFDGTLTSNNLKLFINGAADSFGTIYSSGTTLVTSVPRNSASSLRVGASGTSDTVGFYGLIDDVRVYSRALTVTEIQDLYAAAPSNMGPKITAPASVSGSVGVPFALATTVTDDSSTPTLGWSTVAGPGNATFDNPAAATTNATCALGGTFTLRLIASDGTIVTFADVTANVTGQSFGSWTSSLGLSGSNAALLASPAGDRVSNLMKYALGINPNQVCVKSTDGTNPGLPLLGGDSSNLTLTFQKDTAKSDLTYTVESSTDMITWTSALVTQLITGSNGTVQTIQASVPKGANAREFIRLRVTN